VKGKTKQDYNLARDMVLDALGQANGSSGRKGGGDMQTLATMRQKLNLQHAKTGEVNSTGAGAHVLARGIFCKGQTRGTRSYRDGDCCKESREDTSSSCNRTRRSNPRNCKGVPDSSCRSMSRWSANWRFPFSRAYLLRKATHGGGSRRCTPRELNRHR